MLRNVSQEALLLSKNGIKLDAINTSIIDIDGAHNVISTNNSTDTPLAGGATFPGAWEEVTNYASISIIAAADEVGTLWADFSTDGSTTIRSIQLSDTNSSSLGIHSLIIVAKYFKVRVINGPTLQGSFQLQTIYSRHSRIAQPTSRLAQTIGDYSDVLNSRSVIAAQNTLGTFTNVRSDYNSNLQTSTITNEWANLAIAEIYNTYGDRVIIKPKTLIKFGKNTDIDTGVQETVWQVGGNETYATGNTIDTVVSTSTSDTVAVTIEGHTLSGSEFTFVSQTATLTGQTDVVLGTPLARVSRLYNDNGTDLVGAVSVFDNTAGSSSAGVVTPAAALHLITATGDNQSEKCATTFSNVDYGIITQFIGGQSSKTNALIEFELQFRPVGKVWRHIYHWGSSSTTVNIVLNPYIIIPKNGDIRIRATSNTANTEIFASFHAIFGLVQ